MHYDLLIISILWKTVGYFMSFENVNSLEKLFMRRWGLGYKDKFFYGQLKEPLLADLGCVLLLQLTCQSYMTYEIRESNELIYSLEVSWKSGYQG